MATTDTNTVPSTPPRVVTISEAAEMCGTTRNAIRGRVERGSLHSLMRDGVRVIPVSDLERHGLYPPTVSDHENDHEGEIDHTHGHGVKREHVPATPLHVDGLLVLLERTTDRLVEAERRAALLEGSRMLSERSESTMREELETARNRIAELEAELASVVVAEPVSEPVKRRRWFGLTSH